MAKKIKEQLIKNNKGEDVGSVSTTYYKVDEPSYVKAYVKDLVHALSVSNSHYLVLAALLERMDYNNQVNLYPLRRKEISDQVGFKRVESLNNSISRLVASGILMKLQTGSYLINPNYFARGGWDDIRMIRSTITYDITGKLITVVFDKKPSSEITPQNE